MNRFAETVHEDAGGSAQQRACSRPAIAGVSGSLSATTSCHRLYVTRCGVYLSDEAVALVGNENVSVAVQGGGVGKHRDALVVGPAPRVRVQAAVAFPATVFMIPVAATTSRITPFAVSAMNRLPEPSTTTENGSASVALVAGPLSPV